MPCRIAIEGGLDGLRSAYSGQNTISANGTPYAYTTPSVGQGATLNIKPLRLLTDELDDIITAIESAKAGATTVRVQITDDVSGSFDLDCLPAFPKTVIYPGDHINGRVENVSINFLVVGPHP